MCIKYRFVCEICYVLVLNIKNRFVRTCNMYHAPDTYLIVMFLLFPLVSFFLCHWGCLRVINVEAHSCRTLSDGKQYDSQKYWKRALYIFNIIVLLAVVLQARHYRPASVCVFFILFALEINLFRVRSFPIGHLF